MEDFDLSQYFDITQLPPRLPDVELPAEIIWAPEKYEKKTPRTIYKNGVWAYRITHISHKDLPHVNNAVLTFYDTLGSQHTIWKVKQNGKANSSYIRFGAKDMENNLDGDWEGGWVLLRQLIPYKTFNAYSIIKLFNIETQAEQLQQYKITYWDPHSDEDDWGDR